MNEQRSRRAPDATSLPTDWNVIGARIVESAERACAIHHQLDEQWRAGLLSPDPNSLRLHPATQNRAG